MPLATPNDDETDSWLHGSCSLQSNLTRSASWQFLSLPLSDADTKPQTYDRTSDIRSASSLCDEQLTTDNLTSDDAKSYDGLCCAVTDSGHVGTEESELRSRRQSNERVLLELERPGMEDRTKEDSAGKDRLRNDQPPDDPLALEKRRKELRALEAKRRRDAEAKYCETGDIHAFDDLFAPFMPQSDDNKGKARWEWSCEYERWYMVNSATDSKYWAPEL